MTTKTITLDITEAKLPPLVTVKQGDSGRTLEVVVQDGGKDFSAPAGTTATLRIMDTQGRSASVPGTVVAFGGKTTVTVGLTSEALAYAGKYAADIKLSSPDGSESTLNFWLEVQIAPTSDTPIPTPGGGITREELDQALRQNSAADQAHTDEAVSDLAEKTGVKIRPRVCFVDDDGGAPVPTVLFPWMQEHDVPYCFAIATGDIETGGASFASWADLRAMQADSRVSWSCHAINDDVMADYTPEQMEAKYQQWRRDMTAHGLRSDAITVMYNHGSSVQETIDKVVSKFFRYGFSTTKGINTAPFDSYHMLRVGLFPRDGSYTLAQAKTLVDQLVAAGTGVVVFFTHCYFESFDLDGLTELVEYIRAKGVEIAGLEDALRLYDHKTACDCGEWLEASGEPEYSRTIAQATSTNAGQKVANSSAQNCVLTVQVSGKRVRAAGTAYSLNGMISWLDSEGNVIGCVWQEANKSGDNARFSLELPVPYGATAIMVSGNSGRQLPRVEALYSGSGGGVSQEELDQALEGVKAYIDEQDDAFFQSLQGQERRIAVLEAKPAGVSQADFEVYKSQQSESITEKFRGLDLAFVDGKLHITVGGIPVGEGVDIGSPTPPPDPPKPETDIDVSDVVDFYQQPVTDAFEWAKNQPGDTYVVITDIHKGWNAGYSKSMIKALMDTNHFENLINLGDIGNHLARSDVEELIATDWFYGLEDGKTLFTIGNHDAEDEKSGGASVADYNELVFAHMPSDAHFINDNSFWIDKGDYILLCISDTTFNFAELLRGFAKPVIMCSHYEFDTKNVVPLSVLYNNGIPVFAINGHGGIDEYDTDGLIRSLQLMGDNHRDGTFTRNENDATANAITLMNINGNTISFYRIGAREPGYYTDNVDNYTFQLTERYLDNLSIDQGGGMSASEDYAVDVEYKTERFYSHGNIERNRLYVVDTGAFVYGNSLWGFGKWLHSPASDSVAAFAIDDREIEDSLVYTNYDLLPVADIGLKNTAKGSLSPTGASVGTSTFKPITLVAGRNYTINAPDGVTIRHCLLADDATVTKGRTSGKTFNAGDSAYVIFDASTTDESVLGEITITHD